MLDFNNLPAKDKIYYQDSQTVIYCCDNREILQLLSGISAIVTDPPYELGFMGKAWDKTGIAYDLKVWQGCLNALLSGGHLLAFSGTRTYHRMACAIEDAGFDIRDMVEWMYGQGFPKSLDIGKAIDKVQGNEREVISEQSRKGRSGGILGKETDIIHINDKGHSEFEGWGTALKPAHEPICLARKPLSEKTVANNVLKYGTGGLNIDECRVGTQTEVHAKSAEAAKGNGIYGEWGEVKTETKNYGRFPANLIHDGSEEVVAMFPQTGGGNNKEPYSYAGREYDNKETSMFNGDKPQAPSNYNDNGSAARFFYCAKASRSERDRGLDDMPKQFAVGNKWTENDYRKGDGEITTQPMANNHPTVKPLALMSYLIKLITPPEGIILDPFCGSGSTLVAAKQLGYKVIGIELDEKSCEIAMKRCQTELKPQSVMQLEISKEDVKTETML
jgi:site-specific DNA-methyltransferase (adenine-specific)